MAAAKAVWRSSCGGGDRREPAWILGFRRKRTNLHEKYGYPYTVCVRHRPATGGAWQMVCCGELGSDAIAQFTDPAKVEGLVRRFLLRSEAESFAQSGAGNPALQLMQTASTNARYRFS